MTLIGLGDILSGLVTRHNIGPCDHLFSHRDSMLLAVLLGADIGELAVLGAHLGDDSFRLLLFGFEFDLDHGSLIIVQSHLAIILVVIVVLKQGYPLLERAQATIDDNELRDGDTTNVDVEAFSDHIEVDGVHLDLRRQGHLYGLLRVRHILGVKNLVTQTQLDIQSRQGDVLVFLIDHEIRDRDIHIILYTIDMVTSLLVMQSLNKLAPVRYCNRGLCHLL